MRGSQLMAKCRQDQQSGGRCAGTLFFLEVIGVDTPSHHGQEAAQKDIAHHRSHVDVLWPINLDAEERHKNKRNGEYQINPNQPTNLAGHTRLGRSLLARSGVGLLPRLFPIQAGGVLGPLKAGAIVRVGAGLAIHSRKSKSDRHAYAPLTLKQLKHRLLAHIGLGEHGRGSLLHDLRAGELG